MAMTAFCGPNAPEQVLDFRRFHESIRRDGLADVRNRQREAAERLRATFRTCEETAHTVPLDELSNLIDELSEFENEARESVKRARVEIAETKRLAAKHEDSFLALCADVNSEFFEESRDLAILARDLRWKLAAVRAERDDSPAGPIVSTPQEYRLAYGKA